MFLKMHLCSVAIFFSIDVDAMSNKYGEISPRYVQEEKVIKTSSALNWWESTTSSYRGLHNKKKKKKRKKSLTKISENIKNWVFFSVISNIQIPLNINILFTNWLTALNINIL